MTEYKPISSDEAHGLFDESGRPLNFAVCPTCNLTNTFTSAWGPGSKNLLFDGSCGHRFTVPVPAPE